MSMRPAFRSSTRRRPDRPDRPDRSDRPSRARGVAALEMALLLPMLVMVPLGAFEWGRALQAHERLLHGVRAAARHLAAGNPQDATRQAEARQLAVYGRLGNSSLSLVTGLTTQHVRILEPDTTPGVAQVSTARGPVSLVTVSIEGVRHEPMLLPATWGFTLRPVSLTLVQAFF